MTPAEIAKYVGTYRMITENGKRNSTDVVEIWNENDRLFYRKGAEDTKMDIHLHLIPLGNDSFRLGRYRGKHPETIRPNQKVRITTGRDNILKVEVYRKGELLFSATRKD